MNIEINKTRGHSVSSSSNVFSELSVHSNALSMDYGERIQVQSNSNTWGEQTDKEIFQPIPLFYALVKERMSGTINTKVGSGNTHNSYTKKTSHYPYRIQQHWKSYSKS